MIIAIRCASPRCIQKFAIASSNSTWSSSTNLLPRSAAARLFVLSPSGDYAQRRRVTLGRRNTDSVEVLSGLAANERIVTSDYQYYNDISRLNFY
jgi:HlyD family secretion protein